MDAQRLTIAGRTGREPGPREPEEDDVLSVPWEIVALPIGPALLWVYAWLYQRSGAGQWPVRTSLGDLSGRFRGVTHDRTIRGWIAELATLGLLECSGDVADLRVTVHLVEAFRPRPVPVRPDPQLIIDQVRDATEAPPIGVDSGVGGAKEPVSPVEETKCQAWQTASSGDRSGDFAQSPPSPPGVFAQKPPSAFSDTQPTQLAGGFCAKTPGDFAQSPRSPPGVSAQKPPSAFSDAQPTQLAGDFCAETPASLREQYDSLRGGRGALACASRSQDLKIQDPRSTKISNLDVDVDVKAPESARGAAGVGTLGDALAATGFAGGPSSPAAPRPELERLVAELIARGGKTADGGVMYRGVAWKIAAACVGKLPEGKLDWQKHVEPVLRDAALRRAEGNLEAHAEWCYVVDVMEHTIFPQNGLRWDRARKPK